MPHSCRVPEGIFDLVATGGDASNSDGVLKQAMKPRDLVSSAERFCPPASRRFGKGAVETRRLSPSSP